MPLLDIRSASLQELETLTCALGQPSYRAAQIFSWVQQKGVSQFAQMTNLPADFRAQLEKHCQFSPFVTAEKWDSAADKATKYLFALEDNTIIESVVMRHGHGNTLCVSTQAGCRMGCRFCASALGGLARNLTAGEMVAQVLSARRESQARVDGLVLMGCGEPLDNYDQTVRFLSLITHPQGQAIGQRHITLSTCGLVPQMRALAELRLQITLAVSLHTPDDETRRTLMPIARRYSVAETIDACRYYAEATHRRVTFEYALIGGVNDSDPCALALASWLKGWLCHVNLIPVNETTSLFTQSRRLKPFAQILTRRGIPVTVRHSMGADIQAACGQLRGQRMGLIQR